MKLFDLLDLIVNWRDQKVYKEMQKSVIDGAVSLASYQAEKKREKDAETQKAKEAAENTVKSLRELRAARHEEEDKAKHERDMEERCAMADVKRRRQMKEQESRDKDRDTIMEMAIKMGVVSGVSKPKNLDTTSNLSNRAVKKVIESIDGSPKRFEYEITGYQFIDLQIWIGMTAVKNNIQYDATGTLITPKMLEEIKYSVIDFNNKLKVKTHPRGRVKVRKDSYADIRFPYSPYSDVGQAWLTLFAPYWQAGYKENKIQEASNRSDEFDGSIPLSKIIDTPIFKLPEFRPIIDGEKFKIPPAEEMMKEIEKSILNAKNKTGIEKISDGLKDLRRIK